MKRLPAASSLLLLLLISSGVHAQEDKEPLSHLSLAIEALDDMNFERAEELLREALQSGRSRPGELVVIYRLSGEVAAIFGRKHDAVAMFQRMLALDPAAKLPDGLAPKIVRPFEAARDYFASRDPLILRYELIGSDDQRVAISVESDPLGMVSGFELIYPGAGGGVHSSLQEGRERVVLDLPSRLRQSVVVAVVDSYGNHLDEKEVSQIARARGNNEPATPARLAARTETSGRRGAVEQAATGPSDDIDGGPSLLGRWYVWGLLGALAGSGATYFGLQARASWRELDAIVANSSRHTYAEAKAVEQEGRRQALLSNFSLVIASVSGVATLYLLFQGDDKESAIRSRRVGAVVTPGGAQVMVTIDL